MLLVPRRRAYGTCTDVLLDLGRLVCFQSPQDGSRSTRLDHRSELSSLMNPFMAKDNEE